MRFGILTTALVAVSVVATTAFRQDVQALQRMVATERAFAAATAEVGIRDGFLSFFAADAVKLHAGKLPLLTSAREALILEPMQHFFFNDTATTEIYTLSLPDHVEQRNWSR